MEIKKYNEFYNTINTSIDVEKLMEEVEHDCANKSDLDVIAEHKFYKAVVDNGFESIPFIMEKISRCHVIWLRALNEITGESPDNGVYKTSEIRSIWKKWATKNGY